MSKFGSQLIKSLEEALSWTKGDMKLRTSVVEKSDTDGILVDHLEPNHKRVQQEVDNVTKDDVRVDKEPDGKQELDYGSEELDKDKKKKKKKDFYPVDLDEDGNDKRTDPPQPGDLSKKWSEIKKALDSSTALLDMHEASGMADEEAEEKEQEAIAAQQEAPQEGEVTAEDMEHGQASEDEVSDQEGGEAGDENPEVAEDQEDQEGEQSEEETAKIITDSLEEAGMDEMEIAHILEGHGLPIVDAVDQSKVAMNEQKGQQQQVEHQQKNDHQQANHESEIEHKRKMSDLEHGHKSRMQNIEFQEKNVLQEQSGMDNIHKQRMLDLEYKQEQDANRVNDLDLEHKQRMLDLEYESAKKEKDIELEAKKKELDLKVEHKHAAAKDKHAQGQEISGIKHEQKIKDAKRDAAQTSKDEKKGKLKKNFSIEELDSLSKSMKLWNTSYKNGNVHSSHPEHGTVSVVKESNAFKIKHNGKVISTHDSAKVASHAAINHMVSIVKPYKKIV